MSFYEVIVSNIGILFTGPDLEEATKRFDHYVEESKTTWLRAAGEDVCLFEDGEPVRDYTPANGEFPGVEEAALDVLKAWERGRLPVIDQQTIAMLTRLELASKAAESAAKLEIATILVLSMGHLRKETAELADAEDGLLQCQGSTGYGFFTSVAAVSGAVRAAKRHGEDMDDLVPKELRMAAALAKYHKCAYLLYDRDADTIDKLETFDW